MFKYQVLNEYFKCDDYDHRGVYRLFPRCLETPLAQKRGEARHIVRLYRGSLLNQTVFPGSSACAIMEKRSGTRE